MPKTNTSCASGGVVPVWVKEREVLFTVNAPVPAPLPLPPVILIGTLIAAMPGTVVVMSRPVNDVPAGSAAGFTDTRIV